MSYKGHSTAKFSSWARFGHSGTGAFSIAVDRRRSSSVVVGRFRPGRFQNNPKVSSHSFPVPAKFRQATFNLRFDDPTTKLTRTPA